VLVVQKELFDHSFLTSPSIVVNRQFKLAPPILVRDSALPNLRYPESLRIILSVASNTRPRTLLVQKNLFGLGFLAPVVFLRLTWACLNGHFTRSTCNCASEFDIAG
jgi:hypothetical protein